MYLRDGIGGGKDPCGRISVSFTTQGAFALNCRWGRTPGFGDGNLSPIVSVEKSGDEKSRLGRSPGDRKTVETAAVMKMTWPGSVV